MAKDGTPVSPLAPQSYASMPALKGVRLGVTAAGIKYANRNDVMVAVLDAGSEVAGVFTKSKCPSAPVDFCRLNLKGGKARALVVNSGNANAFTGGKGVETVEKTAKLAADALGISPSEIFLASTGVIGEPLNADKFAPVLKQAFENASSSAWEATAKAIMTTDTLATAKAIMTTDTFPKFSSRMFDLNGETYALNGMAKGAGMIAPDMATMLSFLFTDAPIASSALQAALSKAVEPTFNSITVDSDTSTSDTLLLFSTGQGNKIKDPQDKALKGFKTALLSLLTELSEMVARDGEGARKLVKISVVNAASNKSAKKIAFSIANSPLVKTAVAGEDANWGRIVAAVGKAGEPAERDKLSIYFGDIRVATQGLRDPAYSEAETSKYMKGDVIDIKVDIALGKGKALVKTCDLTKEYVAINGDYRS